jgi:para-nitrobenzyl esterase
MKKFYRIVLIVVVFLLMNSKEGFAAGSALYLGPLDAFKMFDNRISALSSGDFSDSQKAARQKETLLQQIHELIPKVENGAYQSAINTLDHEIRDNIQKWIVTGQQTKLLESVDNAIVSVENASQSTITTAYGKVAGAEAGLDCWAWKGMPFAKPPVGNLRWRAPQDPEPWSKIRQFDQSYTRCTQSPLSKEWLPLKTISGSEDCLYLDIYAPKYPRGKLPVYFWIHGGGNFVGGADELTWCSSLARFSHVIVVVIQYRLGPFGFFTHPALNPGGTPEDKSGNYAVLDQIKALKWVRSNIGYFGGDPGNVMIAGESAGGFNTSI